MEILEITNKLKTFYKMKNIIFLAIFIIVSFTTKAQTLVQTMDYITANLHNYAWNKEFSTKCSKNALQQTTHIISGGRCIILI
jgi:hypothetical protein